MEYPHWLMLTGAVMVAFGFVGIAFLKNKTEPAEDNMEQEVAPPKERAQLRSRLTPGATGISEGSGRLTEG
jgi:hypothetical protein